MRYVLVTPPAVPPVSVAEARQQGVGTSTDADALVTALVAAATGHFDGRVGILGRALVNQTWRLDVRRADVSGQVHIDMPNVSAIGSVKYLSSGVEQTWPAEQYRLGSVGNFSFVEPKTGFSWPAFDDQEDALRVTFVAGYGAAASDVPAPIREAIILFARHLFSVVERSLTVAREEIPGVLTKQFVVSEAAGKVMGAAIAALTDGYRVRSL